MLTWTLHLVSSLQHSSCSLLSSSCVLHPSNLNLQLRPCVTFLQCLLLPLCLLQMARDSVMILFILCISLFIMSLLQMTLHLIILVKKLCLDPQAVLKKGVRFSEHEVSEGRLHWISLCPGGQRQRFYSFLMFLFIPKSTGPFSARA